jgi:transcriptional regulator with XRE-family HTH domain
MWREKIIEAKKAQNIPTKMMAEKVRLPEQTITRILSGKTATPRIDTVLDLGASVGLSPWELFSDTTAVLGDNNFVAIQTELEQTSVALTAIQNEYALLSEENTDLKLQNVALKAENDMLRTHIKYKDEIIALHNDYKAVISKMKK